MSELTELKRKYDEVLSAGKTVLAQFRAEQEKVEALEAEVARLKELNAALQMDCNEAPKAEIVKLEERNKEVERERERQVAADVRMAKPPPENCFTKSERITLTVGAIGLGLAILLLGYLIVTV